MDMLDELTDFDNFFYYGQGDLLTEIKSEVLMTLIQPMRSLFYNRSYDSSEVSKYENMPNSIVLQVLIPYAVVAALSLRNTIVTAGDLGPDRRVAVSQSLVDVELGISDINITVQFIPMLDFSRLESLSTNIVIGV